MKLSSTIQISALALVLGIPTARAQEQQQPESGQNAQTAGPEAPIQPIGPAEGGSTEHVMPIAAGRSSFLGNAAQDSDQVQADTHSLSGGETLGLGSLQGFQKMFDPALHFSQWGDNGIAPGHLNAATSVGGSLAMNQAWGRYRLSATYNGAETFYRPDSRLDYAYHNLNALQVIQGGRWTLRMRDDLQVSPQATFGSLDTGEAGSYGVNNLLSAIQPSLVPGQTILTGRAGRLSNTSLGEFDYMLSRRTTVTFTGSYGLLHFLDPGYIDSRNISGRVGYDFALDSRNTISVIYGHDRTSFNGLATNIGSDTFQVAFGRKITGRLAFQIAAGPQLLRLRDYGISIGENTRWSENVYSALTYATRRTDYSLSYFHGLTGGAGVLFGAGTDAITLSATHQFTRFWSGTIDGSFARNNSLVSSGGTTARFDNWFGRAGLARQMGRHVRFILSYGLQEQYQANATCQITSCGPAGLRQAFGITMEWHPLAIGLE
jgi:hypothetical protein